MFIVIIEAKQVENKSRGYFWCNLQKKAQNQSSICSFTLNMLKRQDAKLHSVHDFCIKRWNERHEEKKGNIFFYHHSLGLFIKFLPHDILWSSISVQHMWLLVYVSLCSSFHTSNPCSSSSIPATLSAQVLVKYKCLLPNLWGTIIRLCSCTQEFRKAFLYFFISVCCCPLEVIQLQCMTQGFQIGTTGHPPEWHVLLRAERREQETLSMISVYNWLVLQRLYVAK